jgi:hypothetical protein
MGIAVGGVAATVVGAAKAVATGITQGVFSAASGGGAPAIMPPPLPQLGLRRSQSTGDLGQPGDEICPKCDLGSTRTPHIYRGLCRGLPPSVYFGSRGSRMIANKHFCPSNYPSD